MKLIRMHIKLLSQPPSFLFTTSNGDAKSYLLSATRTPPRRTDPTILFSHKATWLHVSIDFNRHLKCYQGLREWYLFYDEVYLAETTDVVSSQRVNKLTVNINTIESNYGGTADP